MECRGSNLGLTTAMISTFTDINIIIFTETSELKLPKQSDFTLPTFLSVSAACRVALVAGLQCFITKSCKAISVILSNHTI